jgi:hypothetical protein
MEQLVECFKRWFDQSMQEDGALPPLGSRFDDDAIVARATIPMVLADMGLENVSLADLDRWAEQRWFAWKPFTAPDQEEVGGQDGMGIGLPLYVIDRLPLLKALADIGWSDVELAAYAEYEDEYVGSILLEERCPMPSATDDGVEATLAYLHEQHRAVEDEIGARRPREEWPDGWHWRSRSSRLMALDDDALAYRLRLTRKTISRLEADGWHTFTSEGRYRILRLVFVQSQWEEMVNMALLEVERRPLRAGVSWFLTLSSPETPMHDLFAALDTDGGAGTWIQTFQPDWPAIVAHPWCSEGEEELPIRLPGLVLRDGRPTLTDSANPAAYAELYRRWDLGAYFKLHAENAGVRRCHHCHAAIDGPPSKRYCSSECSHAFRQGTLRAKRRTGHDAEAGQEPHAAAHHLMRAELPDELEEHA